LVLSSVVACASVFSGKNDCKETRTCKPAGVVGGSGDAGAGGGSAGEAGAAAGADAAAVGEGGAASARLQRDCREDTECDDGLACNGPERCAVTGLCVPGIPPACDNPDTAHCSVACVEGDGDCTCELVAKDDDGDGQTSAACLAVPGDDCDDARETVFLGAPELCDELDNDCDGKADLADGLTFSGKARVVGQDVDASVQASFAAMAWSDEAKLFGLVWRQKDSAILSFAAYDAQGERKLGPTVVGQYAAVTLAIAPGAGGFGVAWPTAPNTAEFRTVSAAGQLGMPITIGERQGSEYAGLALAYSTTAKRWGLAVDHGLATIDDDGAIEGFSQGQNKGLSVNGVSLVAAVGGFVLGVNASNSGAAASRVYRYAGDFTGQTVVPFDNPKNSEAVRVVSSHDGGFAVVVGAALEQQTSSVSLFDASVPPAKVCQKTLDARVFSAASTGKGYALLARSGPALSFIELSATCEVVPGPSNVFSATYNPSLAAAPSSYATLRSNDGADSCSNAIFGSSYCN
jgi:hypothetical protein